MITGAFLPPRGLVNPDSADPVSSLRIGHDMINADAVILLPGTALIIPERIGDDTGMYGPEHIGVT